MKRPLPKQPVLLPPPKPALWHSKLPAVVTAPALAVMLCLSAFLFLVFQTNELAYTSTEITATERTDTIAPFPVGVDPLAKRVTPNPAADTYLSNPATNNLASLFSAAEPLRLAFAQGLARLTEIGWYQNLASPAGRILIIEPGERKEQVIEHFGRILGWTPEERITFEEQALTAGYDLPDGTLFPGTYVVVRDASPETAAALVRDRFKREVLARYPKSVEDVVPLRDALTIASLLEREAYDFEDMRSISGVIWNRLFLGMKLQIDATMQYAKAKPGSNKSWWPIPRPADKRIDSPYNTYRVEGLPPGPIANPSLAAIVAALNPKETDCLFYFHDVTGGFHCTETYEEHVDLLAEYY